MDPASGDRQSNAGAVMRALLTQTDLIAGGVAVLLLLVLLLAFDLPLYFAIPLAVLSYIGVRLLLVRRGDEDIARDEAREDRAIMQRALNAAAECRRLALKIQKPAVREQVLRVCDQCDRILAVIQEDGTLPAVAPFYDRLLEPFREMLTDYVKLSTRGVRSAEPLLAQNETKDFPALEQAAEAYYERLHRDRVVDLSTLSEMLELSLTNVPLPSRAGDRADPTRSQR